MKSFLQMMETAAPVSKSAVMVSGACLLALRCTKGLDDAEELEVVELWRLTVAGSSVLTTDTRFPLR